METVVFRGHPKTKIVNFIQFLKQYMVEAPACVKGITASFIVIIALSSV